MEDPRSNRRTGGAKAKSFGSLFETIFERMCRLSGMVVTRVPDGCKTIGPRQIIRVKSPFDYIVSYASKTALLDTKTVDGKSFSCSAIKDHQVSHMAAHERVSGSPSGYVIWLRPSAKVFFLNATTLLELMESGGTFSQTHPKAILLGDSYQFDPKRIFGVYNSLGTP